MLKGFTCLWCFTHVRVPIFIWSYLLFVSGPSSIQTTLVLPLCVKFWLWNLESIYFIILWPFALYSKKSNNLMAFMSMSFQMELSGQRDAVGMLNWDTMALKTSPHFTLLKGFRLFKRSLLEIITMWYSLVTERYLLSIHKYTNTLYVRCCVVVLFDFTKFNQHHCVEERQSCVFQYMVRCKASWFHQRETLSALLVLCERSPEDFPHTGQWHGALMSTLTCAWTKGSANNWEAGDLRRHSAHYDVTKMAWNRNGLLKYRQATAKHNQPVGIFGVLSVVWI